MPDNRVRHYLVALELKGGDLLSHIAERDRFACVSLRLGWLGPHTTTAESESLLIMLGGRMAAGLRP